MPNIQEVFSRMQDTKAKMKDLKGSYKDALVNSAEYTKLDEESKTVRARKKEIEMTVRESFSEDMNKLDDLKRDLQSDQEVLNDLAVNQIMEGETVAVKDQYDNHYEPMFKVSFRKFK